MRVRKSLNKYENTAILSVLLLTGLSIYLDYISGNAGTKDWLLLAARKWLSGETLYVDIFEVNPPLIIWLYALPVYISLHTPILDFHALVLMGLCIAAVSVLLCILLMRFHPQLAQDGKKRLCFALLLTLVLVPFVNPIYFADREHLFFMLALPYMLRNMPGYSMVTLPFALRIVVGLLAGVGFCIKPYCILVFAGIQLLVALQQGSFRILYCLENGIIYIIGIAYLFLVWCATPDYFNTVLPMARATYSAFRGKPDVFILFGVFFTFAMTFIEFKPRLTSPYRSDIWYFLGLCLLFLFYALANNGWTYTYLPLESIILIATGFVFWEFRFLATEAQTQGRPAQPLLFGAIACGANLAANGAMAAFIFVSALMSGYSNETAQRIGGLQGVIIAAHARSFGTLTMDFLPWAHLARATGARWDTRFNCLWMLPKFILSDSEFAHDNGWILQQVATDLASDIRLRKPDIIFVNKQPQLCAACKPADVVAFFAPYPDFASAWRQYHFLRVIDMCPPAKLNARQPSAKSMENKACQYDVYQHN